MAIGIRPTVDFAFKLMLGSPEHTSITVHFLNAVLADSPRITQVTILNPILPKETDEDKLSVLDVLAEDEFGRQLNIEMQTSLPVGLAQRLVYYSSCLYAGQLNEGIDYGRLRSAISICVLEQPMFPQLPRLHLDFQLRDQAGVLLTADLQIHLVELSKSQATAHNLSEVSPLERWAFFLRHAERLNADTIRRLLPEPEFGEATGVLEMIARTPEQQLLYDARLKFQRDQASLLAYAVQEAKQEARQAGLQEGRKAGLQEGEQIGQIRLLEQLLGLPQSASEELATLRLDQLAVKLDHLQRQFRDQRGG